MDFDKPKVYGDTFISDGLVFFTKSKKTVFFDASPYLVNPKVHGMRDHPAHGAVMMGGMWGAKVDRTRKQ